MVPFNKWVDQEVAPRMSSFQRWLKEDRADNLVWRTLRSGSELRWLQLVEDAVFGAVWDSVTKVHLKACAMPVDALNKCASLEALSSINAQKTLEHTRLRQT